MPIPLGEPHYSVAIKADRLKTVNRYKVGTNSRTDERSPYRARPGREKIVEENGVVHVYGTLIRSHITPEIVEVEEGKTVSFHLTNMERAQDQTHGFAINGTNVNLSAEPGKTVSATFVADKPGVYPYYCTEFCSALHLEMQGYLLVRPKGMSASGGKVDEGQTYTMEDYNKQVKTNVDTQAVIDSVVAFITSRNFKDFPQVVALVTDATDQLNFAADAKKKSEEYAGKKDYHNGTLWAQQWFQYQVKAADIGLRAKTFLEQNGAVEVKQ
jgi:nitrous-oxide reductase